MRRAQRILLAAAAALPLAGTALADSYDCAGTAPGWTLHFDDLQGWLTFPATTEMDVMLQTPAEGRDWPRAYTLIGERDTAIVLLEQRECRAADGRTMSHTAHVMTQRGEKPILLTGCCRAAE